METDMKRIFIAMLILPVLLYCMTGCQKQPESGATDSTQWDAEGGFANYLTSVREKSDAIRLSLEQEALTQTDMNQISGELRTLWDEALNRLLDEAQRVLPAAELAQLAAEQSVWQADMMTAVEAAGKAYEGGSLYPLVVNSEAARLTEERVYQLYEQLK